MATNKQQREAREARDRLRLYSARQQVHAHQRTRRVRDNVIAVAGILLVAGLAATTQIVYFETGPGAPTPEPSASAEASNNIGAPDASESEYRTWTGQLTLNDTVSLGLELDGEAAPQAVAGILQDIDGSYYPGKTCHRLTTAQDFGVLQCGSVDGTGAGDPSFSYGPIENAPADDVYPAGTIAMARQGDNPDSNGHQFFIVYTDTTIPSDSAGGYTVVGRVTSGLDALITDIVAGGITPVSSETDGAPAVPTMITSFSLT